MKITNYNEVTILGSPARCVAVYGSPEILLPVQDPLMRAVLAAEAADKNNLRAYAVSSVLA